MNKMEDRKKIPLTEREYETYKFLIDFIKEHGYAPTYQEIADGLYLSAKSCAKDRLQKLEIKGKIEILQGSPRAIKVIGYKFVKED